MATFSIEETVTGLITPTVLNPTTFAILLQKWQHLLYEGIGGIAEADIEDEDAWPYLANMLISYLIIRDLVYNSLNNAAFNAASSSSSTSGGGIKKIETGPVNIERYDSGSSTAKAFATMFSKEGLWEDIMAQICGLAARFGVHVSGCKQDVIIPLKVIRASDYSYENQYPRTPATVTKPAE